MSNPLALSSAYSVKIETLHISGHDFRIRSLKNRQQFNDDDGAAERAGISSASWPIFGQLWPCGQILAQIMRTFPTGNKRILEVGCGMALSSLVLQQRGSNISACDYHPEARHFLTENMHLNALADIDFHQTDWNDINAALGKFDLIIGSDILYEAEHAGLLSAFIQRHAEHSAEVIIVDPNRGHNARFSKKMVDVGYQFDTLELNLGNTDGLVAKGRVLSYQRY